MANGVVTRFLKCLLSQRPTETTADVTDCSQSFQRSLELVEKVDQSIEQKKCFVYVGNIIPSDPVRI